MGVVIGVLMLVAGFAAVVMGAMGTQNQVFDVLTGHTPPVPGASSGGGGGGAGGSSSGGHTGAGLIPNPFSAPPGVPSGPITGIPFMPIGFGAGQPEPVGVVA